MAEQTAQHEKELARLREEKKIAQDMIRFEFGLAALADSSKPDPMWVGVCVPARAGGSVVVDLVDAVGMTPCGPVLQLDAGSGTGKTRTGPKSHRRIEATNEDVRGYPGRGGECPITARYEAGWVDALGSQPFCPAMRHATHDLSRPVNAP